MRPSRPGCRPSRTSRRRRTLISDHPVWLAGATGRPAIALPDEPARTSSALARRSGPAVVVLVDERGRYPGACWTRSDGCLAAPPERIDVAGGDVRVFRLEPGCGTP